MIVSLHRRVADAFSSRSHHLIKMPTKTEMEESARKIEDRFRLKNVALGVHLHMKFAKFSEFFRPLPQSLNY